MKEYTVITTCQVTAIVQADDIELPDVKEIEQDLKDRYDVDDVKVTNRQIFVRDLPNTSEVVVETSDLAVQGG